MGMQILQALPNKKETLCANNQQRKGFPPAKLAGKRSFISRPSTARPAEREREYRAKEQTRELQGTAESIQASRRDQLLVS
jgi:hypothetical protein